MFKKEEIEINGVVIKTNPKILKNKSLSDKKLYRILSIISIIGSVFVIVAGVYFAIIFTNAKLLSEFVSSNYVGTNKSNFSLNVIKIFPILFCYIGGAIMLIYIIATFYVSAKNKAILRYNWSLTLISALVTLIMLCAIEVIVTRILYEIRHVKFSKITIGDKIDFTYKPASWIAKAIGTMDLNEAAAGKGKISFDNYVVVFALVISLLSVFVLAISLFNIFTATKFIDSDLVLKHNEKVILKLQASNRKIGNFFKKIYVSLIFKNTKDGAVRKKRVKSKSNKKNEEIT